MNERCNTSVCLSEKFMGLSQNMYGMFYFISFFHFYLMCIDYRIKLPGDGQTGSREQYCTVCHNKPIFTNKK